MSASNDLLIEIGTEELPIYLVKKLAIELSDYMRQNLMHAGFSYAEHSAYSSPRRLAVIIKGLASPTLSLLSSRSNSNETINSAVLAANTVSTDSDQTATALHPTSQTLEVQLASIIQHSIQQLSVEHTMRWGLSKDAFVRHPKWLVVLLNDTLIPCHFLGLNASRATYGHSIHKNTPITLAHTHEYEQKLMYSGYVIASFEARRQRINEQLQHQASQLPNASPLLDDMMLDDVAASVEWPVALSSTFDETYLKLPIECVKEAIQSLTNCFCIVNEDNELLPHFIVVTGFESRNPVQVISGYKQAINAKLFDAEFLFHRRIAQTKAVNPYATNKNDTEKPSELVTLSTTIAEQSGADITLIKAVTSIISKSLEDLDLDNTDTINHLINENASCSPEEGAEIAHIIRELNLFDKQRSLPESPSSSIILLSTLLLTITDRFIQSQDTLDSMTLSVAEEEQATTAIELLIKQKQSIDLLQAINAAMEIKKSDNQSIDNKSSRTRLLAFFFSKLKSFYFKKGITADAFHAVQARRIFEVKDFDLRVNAVYEQIQEQQDEMLRLGNLNRRIIKAISHKSKSDDSAGKIKRSLLDNDNDQQLFESTLHASKKINMLIKADRYSDAINELIKLTPLTTVFLDKLIKATQDESETRFQNKINMLKAIRKLTLSIADLSYISKHDTKEQI